MQNERYAIIYKNVRENKEEIFVIGTGGPFTGDYSFALVPREDAFPTNLKTMSHENTKKLFSYKTIPEAEYCLNYARNSQEIICCSALSNIQLSQIKAKLEVMPLGQLNAN